jgi:protein tyrosine/serine phosphatase
MFKKLFTWARGIENNLDLAFGYDFSTSAALRRAWLHFLLIDHGFLRAFWTNLGEISPGVWRSNQPSPRRIAVYKAKGINTILNLRGTKEYSPYYFERKACEAEGVELISARIKARSLVGRRKLLRLLDIFETIDKPFVMHCKSGADRAGLASALYLMHINGVHVSEAKKQLSLRYVHVKAFQTGILDYMLDRYEADTAQTPMPIREWIETVYKRNVLIREFNALRGRV